ETGEVSKLSQRVGRDARLVPLAAVERALLPRPTDLRAELGEDQLVALLGIGALDLRQPELLLRRGPVRAIVSSRPRAQIDAAFARDARQIERPRSLQRSRGGRLADARDDHVRRSVLLEHVRDAL